MTNYSSKVLKGASIIFIASVISSLLGYIIRIILARKLSPENFGLFFAIYNVILLIGWLKGFGLNSAIGKYIPQYNLEKNNDGIKSILVVVTAFTLLSNLLFLAIIYFLPSTIINTYFQSNSARSILLALFIYIFIDGFSTIINGYFLSIYRFFLYSLRDIIIRAAVLLLILFATNLTVLDVAVIYAAASLLNLLVSVFYFFKSFSFFQHNLKISKEKSKELFKFSVPLMIRDFFGIVMARVDNLILVFFRPLVEVGIYNVILPTADMLLIFSRPFGRIMFPLSSELFSLNQPEKINSLLQKIQKHILLLLIPFLATIIVFSGFILKTLFGAQYEVGYLGLDLLALGFLFNSLSMVSYSVLMGIGKQNSGAMATIVSNILNAGLILLLVPYFGKFELGYVGAIIGTVISSIVLFFWISSILRKALKYTFPLKQTLFLVFIGLFIITIGYLLKVTVVSIYLQIIFFLGGLLFVYPLLLFLFGITSLDEIKAIITITFKKKVDPTTSESTIDSK